MQCSCFVFSNHTWRGLFALAQKRLHQAACWRSASLAGSSAACSAAQRAALGLICWAYCLVAHHRPGTGALEGWQGACRVMCQGPCSAAPALWTQQMQAGCNQVGTDQGPCIPNAPCEISSRSRRTPGLPESIYTTVTNNWLNNLQQTHSLGLIVRELNRQYNATDLLALSHRPEC